MISKHILNEFDVIRQVVANDESYTEHVMIDDP